MEARVAAPGETEQENQNPRPQSIQKQPRELKVEDALLYLDQVKMEFSDKPQIYNEFLDIMKNFKAQSINTPGVIERVKNLFKGYNKLILGFNTFLPEGEGYKIELTPEEQAFNHPGQEVGPSSMGSSSQYMGAPPAEPIMGMGMGMGMGAVDPQMKPLPVGMGGTPNAQFPPMPVSAGPPMAPIAMGAGAGLGPGIPAPGPPASQPGQLQQAHAIHYVTKIRNRFSNEPETYRSFLKILHTYQKEQKGIKEVLEQVSQLFAEHPDLLMEFTFFLPDAVQEQAKERLHRAARESEARRHARLHTAAAQKGRKLGARGPGAPVPMSGDMMGMGLEMGGQMAMGGQMGGTKRSRADRDAIRAAAAAVNAGGGGLAGALTPAQQQQYAMQLAAAGIDDPQAHLGLGLGMGMGAMGSINLPMGKKQQLAAGMGAGLTVNGQPRKINRRKNQAATPAGMGMGMGMGMGEGMMGIPNMDMLKGGPLSHQHQVLLLQQQQQALAHQLQLQQHQAQQQAQQQAAQRAKDSHLSVSAERRFFEQVKEVLVASSRETWNEFVKCLELFSNDAITKEDMVDLVQDLFGPPHSDLFAEFKRLLSSREMYEAHKSDVWYAVPLSEIDFTQCRKCTPSYRALPRDYPKAKCTERSEGEQAVLNDQWVSIPIGSEESYSFKHMRKNQYEEALFKCEDERFEVDMVIDSNMCAIRILEPLAEEIGNLKQIESQARNADGGEASGLSIAPRFSLQLEKRHLSTIHLNAIARIYGDNGEEILELLRRNPAGTIPVLLKRLRQKDLEWRKARSELNKHWREIVEKNHYRSFDHRSFYFRQQDRKYMSTKQLVQEITQLSSPHAATVQVEDPNTVSVSMGVGGVMDEFGDADMTGVSHGVPQDKECLLAGMTPHIVLTYDHDADLVHRDIYRIMCHAAETTLSSNNDKERLAALWRDLLRVFFNIPLHYLYPTSPVQEVPVEAVEVEGEMAVDTPIAVGVPRQRLHPSEAWAPGTRVVSMYGSAEVLSYRDSDGMYCIQLAFGTAYVSPATIYGSEQLTAGALYVIGVTPSETPEGQDVIFNDQVKGSEGLGEGGTVCDPSKLFYGTQMFYIFLRLHHTLYVRLRIAKQLAAEAQRNQRSGSSGDAEADLIKGADRSKPVYNYFLGQVMSLVEGSLDNLRFEEICRSLLGNKSYVLFTLDKIITQGVKHLQAMANDEHVNKLIGLFLYHHTRGKKGGGVDPVLYRNHVACILTHTMEDVFRVQLVSAEAGAANVDGSSLVAVQQLGILTNRQVVGVVEPVVVEVEKPLSLHPVTSTNSLVSMKTPKVVVSDDDDDDEAEAPAEGGL